MKLGKIIIKHGFKCYVADLVIETLCRLTGTEICSSTEFFKKKKTNLALRSCCRGWVRWLDRDSTQLAGQSVQLSLVYISTLSRFYSNLPFEES